MKNFFIKCLSFIKLPNFLKIPFLTMGIIAKFLGVSLGVIVIIASIPILGSLLILAYPLVEWIACFFTAIGTFLFSLGSSI